MKNLLRKLRIGDDNDDQVVRLFHEGLGSGGGSPLALSPSSASSGSMSSLSSSPALWESKHPGLSTLWNSLKERVNADDELSSNPTRSAGQLRNRLDSSSGGGDDSSTILASKRTVTPPGSFKRPSTPDSKNRGSLLGSENQVALTGLESEEDYQMQTAIDLIVVLGDNQNTTAGVALNEPAKRISLGITSAVGSCESDAISYRYWACNTVGYDEVITNGFYDLFGVGSSSHVLERMPTLSELQKMPVSDTLNIEVILVDREHDPELVALEDQAAELAARAGMKVNSLARKIAALVAERMGGPVISQSDMLLRWRKASWADKDSSQNVVMSLGSLNVGLTRHRALLFKVLADRVGIPCQLLKGRHHPGVEEEGAVNLIKVDHNRELIIDLMVAPGALLPSDRSVTDSSESAVSMGSTITGPEPEGSSSVVSSIQSSRSGSPHSTQSDVGIHSKDMKPYPEVDIRHHSEPLQLQGLDTKTVRHGPSNRKSQFRSPSWTEGIILPGGWQMDGKDVSQSPDVAATSAVAGRVIDFDESLVQNSSHQPCSGEGEMKVEENQKDATGHMLRRSDDRTSESDGSGNSCKPSGMSDDGLDGEVSRQEESFSENASGNVQKGYDVAEWEISWEDVVIGERIGIGSYGEVYRSDWHGSDVAVKKFLDQALSGYALEEFKSEMQIMRRLRHPNVVLFMGAITRPPHLSIVTEFLPRGSLYRLIHRPNSQLDERRRLRMALDVAKGMNYLHSGNPVIVHRDLKSPNLIVDKNWVVKVCDFGMSRMKYSTFLSSKSSAGTTQWMAPEMLRNEPANEKCDVYSFGVVLWELATLQQPWAGLNPMQVVGAVGFQHRRLDIPPDMDPSIARIIRDCWQTNPNLRPSFLQLMAALKPLQRPLSEAQQSESREGSAI